MDFAEHFDKELCLSTSKGYFFYPDYDEVRAALRLAYPEEIAKVDLEEVVKCARYHIPRFGYDDVVEAAEILERGETLPSELEKVKSKAEIYLSRKKDNLLPYARLYLRWGAGYFFRRRVYVAPAPLTLEDLVLDLDGKDLDKAVFSLTDVTKLPLVAKFLAMTGCKALSYLGEIPEGLGEEVTLRSGYVLAVSGDFVRP